MTARIRRPEGLLNRIREIRTEQGLSQRELARRVGCDHTQISRWEAGRQGMYAASAAAVARALGVSVDDLGLREPVIESADAIVARLTRVAEGA